MGEGSKVLDVGCGVGGTSRFLAASLGCTVTGITISSKQVEIATRLTRAEAEKASSPAPPAGPDADGFFKLGAGRVRFVEMDAETMGERFREQAEEFDAVWICEALSHIPGKDRFFRNAKMALKKGGKLVVADWFKNETVEAGNGDIKAIEGILSPLFPFLVTRSFGMLTWIENRWHAPASPAHAAWILDPGKGCWAGGVC